MNELVLALYNIPHRKIPIWLIRQAGRYLPGYRKLRAKYSFLELAKNPLLAARITIEPVRRFELDACIVFSDILFLLEALGAKIHLNETPKVFDGLRIKLKEYDELENYFSFLVETIKIVKSETKKPLLGFSGGLYTLFHYLVSSYMEPRIFYFKYGIKTKKLLDIISSAIKNHLKIQEKAGCDAVVIFDTLAGSLPESEYSNLMDYYKGMALNIPVVIYARGYHNFSRLYEFSNSIIVDSNVDIGLLKRYNSSYQGNLDPYILLTGGRKLQDEVERIIEAAYSAGYIFNISAGVLPSTPLKNIELLVKKVKDAKH